MHRLIYYFNRPFLYTIQFPGFSLITAIIQNADNLKSVLQF